MLSLSHGQCCCPGDGRTGGSGDPGECSEAPVPQLLKGGVRRPRESPSLKAGHLKVGLPRGSPSPRPHPYPAPPSRSREGMRGDRRGQEHTAERVGDSNPPGQSPPMVSWRYPGQRSLSGAPRWASPGSAIRRGSSRGCPPALEAPGSLVPSPGGRARPPLPSSPMVALPPGSVTDLGQSH